MYSIILCGGSGTRLWPLSRKNYPKQFLNLYSDKSLLQETFLRMRKILPAENIVLVTNKENYFNVVNQIKEIEKDFSKKQILTEPASLNTLPAIVYAIKYLVEVKKVNSDSKILVLPADHYIGEQEEYLKLLDNAIENIGDNIGTIGITPTKPEIGYGYIKKGASAALSAGNTIEKETVCYKVDKFVEKPNKKTAEEYINSGQYVWNSGIYLFKISALVRELKKYVPEIYDLLVKCPKIFLGNFPNLQPISIDIGISEKSDKMIVFEGEFGWSDIGSFDSLAEIIGEDKNSRHINLNSKNIFVHCASNRLVATSGVEDLIIVENNDSILIQKKGDASASSAQGSEDIRKIVKHLNEHGYKEAEHNLIVHRPWGKYEVLIEEAGVKAKKITVYPGAKLSLQYHYHRAEHWVVVRGMAKIVNGENEIFLRENESTFIPALTKHRLENPGKTNLEIVEIQTGNYTEEDDIVRFDDVYNRDKE